MRKNITPFYIISFLQTLNFTTAIWAFFFTSYLRFSFGEALLIITIVGIVGAIFEIPSGAWADRFGRKKMYITGTLLLIINLFIWLFAVNFWTFIIAGFFAGLGYALTSGNLEAIIHDGLEEQKNEKEFKNISAQSYIFIFLGRAVATSTSGLIFVLHPTLPVYFTLISTILILIFILCIREPEQVLSKHVDNISHLKEGILFLTQNKFIVIFIVILGLLSGLGNIYFFTQQIFFKELGLNIELISITFTIGALFSALGSYIFKRISDLLPDKEILNILIFMTLLSSILFILFIKIFAIFGLIILSIMFGFIMTFGNNFLIHKVPKNQKSTILSIFSLSITIGYAGFNIILAFIIGFIGLQNIYLITLSGIGMLLILNLLTFNRSNNIVHPIR